MFSQDDSEITIPRYGRFKCVYDWEDKKLRWCVTEYRIDLNWELIKFNLILPFILVVTFHVVLKVIGRVTPAVFIKNNRHNI